MHVKKNERRAMELRVELTVIQLPNVVYGVHGEMVIIMAYV